MANVLIGNPIIIDTVMTQSWKSAVAATLGSYIPLLIEKVYWRNPGTIGDTAVLADASGTPLLTLRCEVANQSQLVDWTAAPKLFRDFYVSTLASGVLYIYTR